MQLCKVNIVTTFLIFFLSTYISKAEAAELVTLEIPQKIEIAAGVSSDIAIVVVVKDGYHVQANPASDKFLIPTTIEIISVKDDVIVSKPKCPPGKPFTLESESTPISVYDGRFKISLPVLVQPSTQTQHTVLTGDFRYQACDYKRCYFPETIMFKIPINIEIVNNQNSDLE